MKEVEEMELRDAKTRAVGLGFSYAWGALQALLAWAICVSIGVLIWHVISDVFNIDTNDTDLNGRNRSGLILHTDHGTGVQYLSTKDGHLIRRAVPDED